MKDLMREALRAVLDPKSVAIIGASENPNKLGGRPLLYLSRFRLQGSVYPINSKRSEVQGYTAYPSLTDLPEAPEVAIVVVPAMRGGGGRAVRATGVRVAIVMTSRFRRDGRRGRQSQRNGTCAKSRAPAACA